MSLWLIGFIAALIVVLLVATLLLGILVEARRIRALALAASDLVQEIDANTRIVWALRDTNAVAGTLLGGAAAIDANAAAIVGAVSGAHDEQSAA
jgi:multisubunit Na+/H+ antiporter MnhE subunit